MQGMVETICRSIAITDETSSTGGGSFADSQTRMTQLLEEIRKTAQDMPYTEAQHLGHKALNLSEKFR